MTTTTPHPMLVPHIVDDLEARIMADAAKALEARADTLKFLADETVTGDHPYLESTILDLAGSISPLDADTLAARFDDLVEATRELRKLTGSGDWQGYLVDLGFGRVTYETYAVVEEHLASDVDFAVRALLTEPTRAS